MILQAAAPNGSFFITKKQLLQPSCSTITLYFRKEQPAGRAGQKRSVVALREESIFSLPEPCQKSVVQAKRVSFFWQDTLKGKKSI
ncbi:hypothetical protein DWX75_06665 [Mitsuokella sp. AF21-1AC]|nr:hypothetical protein DWX75_06665 [Mitsuokella sp. AF21-1AC]